jgi:hypothetical protein
MIWQPSIVVRGIRRDAVWLQVLSKKKWAMCFSSGTVGSSFSVSGPGSRINRLPKTVVSSPANAFRTVNGKCPQEDGASLTTTIEDDFSRIASVRCSRDSSTDERVRHLFPCQPELSVPPGLLGSLRAGRENGQPRHIDE